VKSMCPISPRLSKKIKKRVCDILNKNTGNRVRWIKINNYLKKLKLVYEIKINRIVVIKCCRFRKKNTYSWLYTRLTFRDKDGDTWWPFWIVACSLLSQHFLDVLN